MATLKPKGERKLSRVLAAQKLIKLNVAIHAFSIAIQRFTRLVLLRVTAYIYLIVVVVVVVASTMLAIYFR